MDNVSEPFKRWEYVDPISVRCVEGSATLRVSVLLNFLKDKNFSTLAFHDSKRNLCKKTYFVDKNYGRRSKLCTSSTVLTIVLPKKFYKD